MFWTLLTESNNQIRNYKFDLLKIFFDLLCLELLLIIKKAKQLYSLVIVMCFFVKNFIKNFTKKFKTFVYYELSQFFNQSDCTYWQVFKQIQRLVLVVGLGELVPF